MIWGLGLVGTSPDDIVDPRFIAWDSQCVSAFAKLVAVSLSRVACDISGEVIVDYQRVKDDCICDDDDERGGLLSALGELVRGGVLRYARVRGDLLFACFDVTDDWYYGDDQNPPPDWTPPGSNGDEWAYEEDVEDASVDPDPRRHRIFSKTNYRCFYCIEAWADQLDHMHPRIRGGGNEDENMIGACRACNIRKKDRTIEEYRAWLSHRHRLPSMAHVHFYGERAT